MISLAALSALAFAAGAAEKGRLFQEARLMNAGGSAPVVSGSVTVNGVNVPTDTNGNVAVYFEGPAFTRDAKDATFKNAVNGTTLEPAVRLGAAPGAIHADEADEAKSGQFAPGGAAEVSFGALTADRAYVADQTSLEGDTRVNGPIEGVKNLYVGTLSVGTNTTGNALLRPKLNNGLSCIFNENVYDKYVGVDGRSYLWGNEVGAVQIIAEDDGFAWVAACSTHSGSTMDGSGCQALVTIQVAHGAKEGTNYVTQVTTYAQDVDCRTNDELGSHPQPKNVNAAAFCFLVPVRRNDVLFVKLETKRSWSYWIDGYCGIKMLYFGVAQ